MLSLVSFQNVKLFDHCIRQLYRQSFILKLFAVRGIQHVPKQRWRNPGTRYLNSGDNNSMYDENLDNVFPNKYKYVKSENDFSM